MGNNWRASAKCGMLSLQESEELFFPKSGRAKNAAIKFCNQGAPCPVREQCLEFALDNDCRGIWAGTTYKDRLAITIFRNQLNGIPVINPRANAKKPKRSGFKLV